MSRVDRGGQQRRAPHAAQPNTCSHSHTRAKGAVHSEATTAHRPARTRQLRQPPRTPPARAPACAPNLGVASGVISTSLASGAARGGGGAGAHVTKRGSPRAAIDSIAIHTRSGRGCCACLQPQGRGRLFFTATQPQQLLRVAAPGRAPAARGSRTRRRRSHPPLHLTERMLLIHAVAARGAARSRRRVCRERR